MRCQQSRTWWFEQSALQSTLQLLTCYTQLFVLAVYLDVVRHLIGSIKKITMSKTVPRERLIVCSFSISFGVKNCWSLFFLNLDFRNFFSSLSWEGTPFDSILSWNRLVNLAFRISWLVLRRWLSIFRRRLCSLWISLTAFLMSFGLGSVPFTDLMLILLRRLILADVMCARISIALFVNQLNIFVRGNKQLPTTLIVRY